MQKNNKESLLQTYQLEDMTLTIDLTRRHKASGTLAFNIGSEKVQMKLKGIHMTHNDTSELSLFGEIRSAYKLFKEVIALSGNIHRGSITIKWLTIGSSDNNAHSSGQIVLYEKDNLITKSQMDSNVRAVKEFKKNFFTLSSKNDFY